MEFSFKIYVYISIIFYWSKIKPRPRSVYEIRPALTNAGFTNALLCFWKKKKNYIELF